MNVTLLNVYVTDLVQCFQINLSNLIAEIRKAKTIEKEIALTNSMKTIPFTKKWLIINNIIP